ncbi:MAG: uracil-DNA glycosylase family protein, partial [Pyrinomonadaceae bacterium]
MSLVGGPLCGGCPLEPRGTIFIPFDGLGLNRVMLVGDSGWEWEARNVRSSNGKPVGTPFSGPSGWFIDRNLKRIGATRADFVIANSFWCKAPHLGFTDHPERYPEAALALEHCRPYLDDLIERMKPKVLVPMGNVALRRVAGLSGIQQHQGYYISTPYGIPAVPTFHPSYILKGNQKLSGVWCMAVQRALDIAQRGAKPRQYDLLLDPPLQTAREYLTQPNDLLVCDIETPNTDDNEEVEDASYTIVRISFSNRVGTAISLPWAQPYIRLCHEVLAGAKQVVFWNQGYDLPRLRAAGCTFPGRIIDAMFAWHFLQSDLPKA